MISVATSEKLCPDPGRSNSTYRNGSRSVTIRKRLEVMSRQCEMMEKEKDGLQRALGDREEEISSLLRYGVMTEVENSLFIQWNPSNPDTLGTEESVLISEVS